MTIDGEYSAIPHEEALFVLRIRGDAGSEIVAADHRSSGGVTYRLVNSQGLVAKGPGGSATLPLSYAHLHTEPEGKVAEHFFADDVIDVPYSDLVDQVRALQ